MRRPSPPALLLTAAITLAVTSRAGAASSPVGEWVRQPGPGDKGLAMMALTIEQWGPDGVKLTYHGIGLKRPMTIWSANPDGSDAPVLIGGKPTAQTMAIKWIDAHHLTSVQKQGGKVLGTSTATLSPDFTTMTIENDYVVTDRRHKVGKSTEVWTRK
jgi:hypothetical protein